MSHGPLRPLCVLLQRVLAFDILVCPECGGRVRLLATIDDMSAGPVRRRLRGAGGGLRSAGPAVIHRILRHLGLPVEPPLPTPARDPPWVAGLLPRFDAGSGAGASPPDIWPH